MFSDVISFVYCYKCRILKFNITDSQYIIVARLSPAVAQ